MIRKVIYITCFILITGTPGFSGPDNYLLGARFAAMGNASVMIPDLWSLSHNQAGLGWGRSTSAGFHFENKFVIPQYSLSAAGIAIPVKPGTLGVMIYYFGYSKYPKSVNR